VSLWDRATLATHVGYLPQSVDLLPGTVAQNIARFGDADPDRIAEAARLARCHDLILSLPAGFDTEIGDHAEHLSFGQRQRIALARAVYGNPKLVVLDEPNANLDAEGEQALMACMRDLKARGITVVLIAHKASVLSSSERLMVLHRGRIQALGPTMQVLRQLATRSAPRRAAPPRTAPVAKEHPPAQMEASAA
jgi:ABC-type protease/lipase transport system fused ATPase/permease subunit